MFRLLIALLLFFLNCVGAYSQPRNLHYSFEAQGVASSSPERMPFWLRSNQYGSVPLPGTSLSIINRVSRDYDSTQTKLIDWGAAFEGRANIGDKTQLLLIEGYGKLRVGPSELRAGRSKEIMGLVDTTLSSGAFSVSGNALGIPKVQISIPEFYTLPLLNGLFAFKGNFAHGWVGSVPIGFDKSRVNFLETYLHQKSFYGRFGKANWSWKLYGGFNHQVTWGNYANVYAEGAFTLSPWQEYIYTVSGKKYGSRGIEVSKIGNHIGSIDLGFEYDFQNVKLFAYRQNFYDVGALYYLANILDGLNGLSLSNKKASHNAIQWKKLVFELLYTKNQAGEAWAKVTPSGDEDYYNNYMYSQGWSYKGVGLGSPFLSTKTSTRQGLPTHPANYFINNRVLAMHFGVVSKIKEWNLISKASYARSYGTYGTSTIGHSLGSKRYPGEYGIFQEVGQLSTYIEANRTLANQLNLGILAAVDYGGLLDNSGGIIIKLSKSL
ncbi:capsule assembly Wzi family protein [Pontibacter harenae]|uniref:capsule assembly Wzi family protein n=1 Tax=Pontibacter harenae TaxID=2894083 RepID=UPI001E5CEFBC|nr:capsule assembly Wzi family protein [Pontibacter harenae]MCC9166166.1 capsule assembly Wzi family protein [Pontibacter harenae]